MARRSQVTVATESAFHALALPDAEDLVLRADLMRKIGEIVDMRGLTQVQAGTLMHMDQPRVSALLKGRITKFSTDRLLKALSDLGQDVELRITPSRSGRGRLHVAA